MSDGDCQHPHAALRVLDSGGRQFWWCGSCGAVAAADGGLVVVRPARSKIPPGQTAWVRPGQRFGRVQRLEEGTEDS